MSSKFTYYENCILHYTIIYDIYIHINKDNYQIKIYTTIKKLKYFLLRLNCKICEVVKYYFKENIMNIQ